MVKAHAVQTLREGRMDYLLDGKPGHATAPVLELEYLAQDPAFVTVWELMPPGFPPTAKARQMLAGQGASQLPEVVRISPHLHFICAYCKLTPEIRR